MKKAPQKGTPIKKTSWTDQEVVAAINSCFDLNKYRALPGNIKERFKKLLSNRRVGSVCFMHNVGLGLRVYEDLNNKKVVLEEDEIEKYTEGTANVDLDGVWLRCPASLYESPAPPPPPPEDRWIVMDEKGQMYLDETEVLDDPNDDSGVASALEGSWSSIRGEAIVYVTKSAAEEVAKKVNGVVVKK